MHVQPQYFEAISDGTKRMEARIAKRKYKSLQKGDTIIFQNTKTKHNVIKIVTGKIIFPTFLAMLQHFGVEAFLPMYKDLTNEAARDLYYGFANYKKEELDHGVVALRLGGLNHKR